MHAAIGETPPATRISRCGKDALPQQLSTGMSRYCDITAPAYAPGAHATARSWTDSGAIADPGSTIQQPKRVSVRPGLGARA